MAMFYDPSFFKLMVEGLNRMDKHILLALPGSEIEMNSVHMKSVDKIHEKESLLLLYLFERNISITHTSYVVSSSNVPHSSSGGRVTLSLT